MCYTQVLLVDFDPGQLAQGSTALSTWFKDDVLPNLSSMPHRRLEQLAGHVIQRLGGANITETKATPDYKRVKRQLELNLLPLSELRRGVCRHRSLLFKALCDALNLDCQLQRGKYSGAWHAWNVCQVQNQSTGAVEQFVVDLTQHGAALLLYTDANTLFNKYSRLFADAPDQPGPVDTDAADAADALGMDAWRLPTDRRELRIESLIASGNFGTVKNGRWYQARVAVKEPHLPQDLSERSRLRERFNEEITILSRLRHPHVAQLLAASLPSDTEPFMVLELVHTTLEALLRQGECPWASPDGKIVGGRVALQVINGFWFEYSS